MQQILVITHNGLPPSQGGKRLGYVCGDLAFMFGGPPQGISLSRLRMIREEEEKKAVPVPPSSSPPVTMVVYNTLKEAQYSDGECPHCGKYPNPTVDLLTTTGMRRVVQCTKCNEFARPYGT